MNENGNIERSSTTKKQYREGGVTGKGFVKGSPNINRKGRPKVFNDLRKLALEIANDIATKDGKPIYDENGKGLSVIDVIMKQWAFSKDPRFQKAFVEICYGKVPDVIELPKDITIKVEYKNKN